MTIWKYDGIIARCENMINMRSNVCSRLSPKVNARKMIDNKLNKKYRIEKTIRAITFLHPPCGSKAKPVTCSNILYFLRIIIFSLLDISYVPIWLEESNCHNKSNSHSLNSLSDGILQQFSCWVFYHIFISSSYTVGLESVYMQRIFGRKCSSTRGSRTSWYKFDGLLFHSIVWQNFHSAMTNRHKHQIQLAEFSTLSDNMDEHYVFSKRCLPNVVYQNRLTMSSITLELKIIIIIIKKFIHNYLFAYVMFFICFEVFPSQLLSSLLAQTNVELKLSSQLRSMWRIALDENNTYAFHEVKFDAKTSVDCIKYSRYVMFCMLCSASRDLETVDSHHRSKKINFSLFSTFFMLESYK